MINQLGISSEKGFMLNHTLQMGGFGISRYSLDNYLSEIATEKGVVTFWRTAGYNSVKKGHEKTYQIEHQSRIFHCQNRMWQLRQIYAVICGKMTPRTQCQMQ